MHYYAREGYPQHVQSVCNELIKHDSSAVLQFWRAYGLLASGPATAEVRGGNSNCSLCRVPLLLMLFYDTPPPSQALRELYSIQQHADVGLAATAALLTAHQAAKVVDDNAVLQLSAYLEVRE